MARVDAGGVGMVTFGAVALIGGFFSGPGSGGTAMALGAGGVALGMGYMLMSK